MDSLGQNSHRRKSQSNVDLRYYEYQKVGGVTVAKPDDLIVFMSNTDSECAECGVGVAQLELVTLKRPSGVLCLSCSDLDHLAYLRSGNTALTTRARKYSPLSAVVMKFSKARKRNERQGVLVSAEGLARAEEECLSDEEQRAVRRERDKVRAEKRDVQYIQDFAATIRRLYPGCQEEIASQIASHACEKHSGRVGRSAGAKSLGDQFVALAVRAHIRHVETNYDELLNSGYDRQLAREQVLGKVEECIDRWSRA